MSDTPSLGKPVLTVNGKAYPVKFDAGMNPQTIRFYLSGVLVATRSLTFSKTLLFDAVEMHPESYWRHQEHNVKEGVKGP